MSNLRHDERHAWYCTCSLCLLWECESKLRRTNGKLMMLRLSIVFGAIPEPRFKPGDRVVVVKPGNSWHGHIATVEQVMLGKGGWHIFTTKNVTITEKWLELD